MKNRLLPVKTVTLCAIVLIVIAVASFVSMNYFDRHIFDNYRPFLVCFAVLSLSMLLCVFCRMSAVALPVCMAVTAATCFKLPAYTALFFPVVLQALLYDTYQSRKKGDSLCWGTAVLCESVTLISFWRCKQNDDLQLSYYYENGSRIEKYLYLLLLLLFALFYGVLCFRRFRDRKKIPVFSGKGKRTALETKRNAAAGARGAVVYLICSLNTLLAAVYSALFLNTEYGKVLFFSQALFLLFLEYRREPMLRLHAKVKTLFDRALTQQ